MLFALIVCSSIMLFTPPVKKINNFLFKVCNTVLYVSKTCLKTVDPLHVRHVAISNVWSGGQTNTAETMIGQNMFEFVLGFKAIG